jgi:hypothetical protein
MKVSARHRHSASEHAAVHFMASHPQLTRAAPSARSQNSRKTDQTPAVPSDCPSIRVHYMPAGGVFVDIHKIQDTRQGPRADSSAVFSSQ